MTDEKICVVDDDDGMKSYDGVDRRRYFGSSKTIDGDVDLN